MKTHKKYKPDFDEYDKDWIRKENRKDLLTCLGVIVVACIVLLIITNLLKGAL